MSPSRLSRAGTRWRRPASRTGASARAGRRRGRAPAADEQHRDAVRPKTPISAWSPKMIPATVGLVADQQRVRRAAVADVRVGGVEEEDRRAAAARWCRSSRAPTRNRSQRVSQPARREREQHVQEQRVREGVDQPADREQRSGCRRRSARRRNQTKPTAVISAPKRFSGRRHQANSPVPMNDQPISGVNTTPAVWTDVEVVAGERRAARRPTPAASPARPRPISARRSDLNPGAPRSPRRRARPWARTRARRCARSARRVRPVAARGEHDRGRAVRRR